MKIQHKSNFIKSKRELGSLVKLGETVESIAIEFKRELDLTKRNSAEETALDICQFSNANGGVILIGVEEKSIPDTQKKVAYNYINVNYETISQFINDKVLPLIHPKSIQLDIISIEIEEKKNIVAINIAPLARGLACVALNTPPYAGKYPYRTHYGKKYFNPLEVEKLMSNSNRYIPIKLQEVFSTNREVTVYPSIIKEEAKKNLSWDTKDFTVIIKNVSGSEFTLNIAGIDINIPYSLTKDVWTTEDEKIGILLAVKLIISSDRRNIYFDF